MRQPPSSGWVLNDSHCIYYHCLAERAFPIIHYQVENLPIYLVASELYKNGDVLSVSHDICFYTFPRKLIDIKEFAFQNLKILWSFDNS